MTKQKIAAYSALTIATVFCLSVGWEYGLEGLVCRVLGIPYEGDFETTERWRFIATSTSFSFLGILIPTFILGRLSQRLRQSYAALDVTRHRAEFLAKVDPLTGLPNRRVFAQTVETLVKGAKGARSAVLVIDLDRFKPVNDIHGHSIGDAVLVEVAKRFGEVAGQGKTICRLGGDEFGAAIDLRSDTDGHVKFGEALLHSLAEPIRVEGYAFDIGATIGVAVYPEDGLEAGALLQAADLAMYNGKRDARGHVRVFDHTMNEEVRARATLEADLERGIKAGEVRPWYQPLVCLENGTITGFEVLARWYRKDGSITPPVEFISVAEETGLISDLTYSVLRQACVDATAWRDDLMLSINISPLQFSDPNLPLHFLAVLSETGFPPQRIEIEITESALMADVEAAKRAIAAFKSLGMRVSLDDFGTGYSSLGHLRQFEFDKVKIDRSFALSMESSPKDAKVLEGIVDLCRGLGLATTAEGIESEALMQRLTEIGCVFGQGYLFSRPLPASDVAPLLSSFDGADMPSRRKSAA